MSDWTSNWMRNANFKPLLLKVEDFAMETQDCRLFASSEKEKYILFKSRESSAGCCSYLGHSPKQLPNNCKPPKHRFRCIKNCDARSSLIDKSLMPGSINYDWRGGSLSLSANYLFTQKAYARGTGRVILGWGNKYLIDWAKVAE